MKSSIIKSFSVLLVATSLLSQPIFAESGCKKNSCCKSFVTITEDDINKASCDSRKGLVLKKSGNYKLCENVNWKAKKINSAAITIEADDVTLDLGGHTIKQVNTLANNSGIIVQENREFVTIHNGALQQMSLSGIYAHGGVSCLTIDSITVHESSYNGSVPTPFPVLGTLPVAAAIFVGDDPDNFAHDITITNCSFCDNGILNGTFGALVNVGAVWTNFTNDITIQNILVTNQYGNNFSVGVHCVSGSGLLLSELNASNITGNREALGLALTLFNDSIVENIAVRNVTLINDENAPQVNNAAGAEGAKYSQADHFVLRRATFENLSVVSTVPVNHTVNSMTCNGMQLSSFFGASTNGLVQDVSVIGVHSDGALNPANNVRAAGFSNDGADNVTYENCFVSDVSITIGHAFGFGSKKVSNNPLRNPRLIFKNCTAQNIEILGTGVYAAGFLLSADQEQVIDCTVDRIIDDRQNPKAYGVILDTFTTGSANNCLVSGNKVTNCSTYGFYDNSGLTTNVFTSNFAAFNATNYQGLTGQSAALIQLWNAAPPVAGPVLANISVQ